MPYFDPSTMRLPQSPSAVESIGSGLKLKEMFQQQQQYQRQQGFMQAIGEIVQSGVDYKTPEGQQKLVQGLAAKGYGAEAFDLAQKFPKPEAAQWDNIPGTGTIYERGTGAFKDSGAKPYAKAENPAPSPGAATKPAWKGERFVRSKANIMVKVDASGRDENGNLVELYKPDKKPAAPKPEPSEKPLSAEAAKTLSVASTFVDDVETLKGAFSQDFEGAIAGIKTGTNPRLAILADQLADKIGRLRSGGAINADEEARFKRAIASIKTGVFASPKEAIAVLEGLANEARFVAEGMDPGGKVRARIKASSAPAAPQSGPKPGDIEDGYRFKGGDPADPNSWEKAK